MKEFAENLYTLLLEYENAVKEVKPNYLDSDFNLPDFTFWLSCKIEEL